MKSRWKTYLLYASLIIIGGSILFGFFQLITSGYSVDWTGFGEYQLSNGDVVGEKKLWDWMELLIIPLVLAIGAFFLQRSERETERENANERAKLEREIAKDRQQEAALQTYLDRISELLLKEKLLTTDKAEVRDIARIQTLTVLRGLDGERKAHVLLFLNEAGLIMTPDPIVHLYGGDFRNAQLTGSDLSGTDLQGVIFDGAILNFANLQNSNLAGATLHNTKLNSSNLTGAIVSKMAFLWGASLQHAILPDGTVYE